MTASRAVRPAALRAVCAAAAMLAGCASAPPAADGWTSGRMSVRVEASPERAAQSLSAAFELRGDAERGELRLSTPIGTQIATARWQPGLVLLATADGERRFDSLDALSRVALGEAVPLAALPDWLAGRPWGGAPSVADVQGFQQLGWAVDLGRQAENRIVARRPSPPAVEVRVQLEAAAAR